ncbi:hypothetical protein VaNZ11_005222 [Volvox africanus]|uniref:Uncharacterized protein n=1 Tax=Volvox africanus TaxID=51714 RepID=A0ABQ5RYG0_9CHLO|nr:hypothetical protein VaNZ11_005222 [Volvox africanus]
MNHFYGKLNVKVLALFATCVLMTEARAGRKLTSTGDILGTRHKPPEADLPEEDVAISRTREIADHAHFYSAADLLTRWAESTFALTAYAHKQLSLQPNSGNGSSCVYDGMQCLFNPYMVMDAGFPAPELHAEKVLKRFATEAGRCRQATDRPSCHLDTNCDWDDVTGACFLAHDPHSDFTSSISPCRGAQRALASAPASPGVDMIYTAVSAACWHREPDLSSIRPCGGAACRLYKAGTGGSWSGGGGAAGLPEDRCMPYLGIASSLAPADVYALMKRYFGTEKFTAQQLANTSLVTQGWSEAEATPAGEQQPGQQPEVGPPAMLGYGNCSTAILHHTMRSACRAVEEGTCITDSRCTWRHVVRGKHCVLSKDTVIDVLLGASRFTQAVRKTEAACHMASSVNACMSIVLTL